VPVHAGVPDRAPVRRARSSAPGRRCTPGQHSMTLTARPPRAVS